jgi:hypothetical protein
MATSQMVPTRGLSRSQSEWDNSSLLQQQRAESDRPMLLELLVVNRNSDPEPDLSRLANCLERRPAGYAG